MGRQRIRITGLVQGVGFRPHVFLLAQRFKLSGWVKNDGEGVLIEVEGKNLDAFVKAIKDEAPPLARIDAVQVSECPSLSIQDVPFESSNKDEFKILLSDKEPGSSVVTNIGPDTAVCDACLSELFDPADRHFEYAFLNCTHCGPRYTIVRELPYDRGKTSMEPFPMCQACQKEYHDPMNRRFHAEPIACPLCGPKLSTDLPTIVKRLLEGEIVAIKGLGGFHLACDAYNEGAVKRLRERKCREAKPFALMVANPASLEHIVQTDEHSLKLLTTKERPIVLMRKKVSKLAPSIAQGLNHMGVMLPYTPLQHLIFWEAAGRPDRSEFEKPLDIVLVMTSANLSDEPLVIDNDEAKTSLSGIVDSAVTHDRTILVRVDDSVMNIVAGAPLFIRRARGYVPTSIKLTYFSEECPSILAIGGDLKNTFCLTRGREAFISQHIGDLEKVENQRFFQETLQHLLKLTDVKPSWIIHDAHPDFYSTVLAGRWAASLGIPPERVLSVQHHHAHVASVAAEYGLEGPILGLSLDGFGLSLDGASWGGELLCIDGFRFERVGSLKTLPEPGGDKASKEPWRMAVAALLEMGLEDEALKRFSHFKSLPVVLQMIKSQLNAPPTSSMGRLFDVASALLGVATVARYEAEAPMLLESFVTKPEVLKDGWSLERKKSGLFVLNFFPLLRKLLTCDVPSGANLFHGTVAAGLTDLVKKTAKEVGLSSVILSGGCILNKILTEELMQTLTRAGLKVYLPRKLPPNDGGLCLGQVYVALARVAN